MTELEQIEALLREFRRPCPNIVGTGRNAKSRQQPISTGESTPGQNRCDRSVHQPDLIFPNNCLSLALCTSAVILPGSSATVALASSLSVLLALIDS